jgi:hypothetical protein
MKPLLPVEDGIVQCSNKTKAGDFSYKINVNFVLQMYVVPSRAGCNPSRGWMLACLCVLCKWRPYC